MRAFATPATRAARLLLRRAPAVPAPAWRPLPRHFSSTFPALAAKPKVTKSRRNSSSVSKDAKPDDASAAAKGPKAAAAGSPAEQPPMAHTPAAKSASPTDPTLDTAADSPQVDTASSVTGGDSPAGNALDLPPSDAVSDDYLTTIFDDMEPYIDTYQVYRQLVNAGFTPSQSDEIINLLIVQLNTKLTKLATKYTQLYELENERYLFESAQQELGVDITRNREQHINDAINQINSLQRDYGIISDELNNHFIQMKNDIQVAINDQKSENTLMSKRVMFRMQETNHRITTELNMAMRSEIESLRWHLSRWGLISILLSICAGCAAFYIYKTKHQKRMNERNEFVPLVIYEPSEYDEDDYHADLDPHAI